MMPLITDAPEFSVSSEPLDSATAPVPLILAMLSSPPNTRLNVPLLVTVVVVAKAAPSDSSVPPMSMVTDAVFSAEPRPVKARVPADTVVVPA